MESIDFGCRGPTSDTNNAYPKTKNIIIFAGPKVEKHKLRLCHSMRK